MQAPIWFTKSLYQRSSLGLCLAALIISAFAGTRPTLPMPYRLGVLAALVVMVVVGLAARRKKAYGPTPFRVMTACAAALGLFLCAQIAAHVLDGHWLLAVRYVPLLALVPLIWLGEASGTAFEK